MVFQRCRVFVISRGADLSAPEPKAGLTVGRIQGAARSRARADQSMNLVNKQNCFVVIEQMLQHRFQALLEIASILGARQQSAHVELVHRALRQHLRHIAFDDAARQALGDRGLADAGFAHQQRIIFAPAA